MGWDGVVTNAGVIVFNSWTIGRTLTITGASASDGTVATEALRNQTALTGTTHAVSFLSRGYGGNSITFEVQITPDETSYTLHQIGIFGSVSGSAELIGIWQNSEGVSIPAASSSSDFVLRISLVIKVSNQGTLEVTIDSTALVSQSDLEDAVDALEDADSDLAAAIEALTAVATQSADGMMSKEDKADLDNMVSIALYGRGGSTETDLNDLTTPGIWWVSTNTTVSHWPSDVSFNSSNTRYAVVANIKSQDNSSILTQILLLYPGTAIYMREQNNGTWQAWNGFYANDSGEIALTSSHKASGVNALSGNFRKAGKCVICDFSAQYTGSVTAASGADIFTLPSGYRPPNTKYFVGRINDKAVRVYAEINGNVHLDPDTNYSSGLTVYGNLQFFTD